MSDNRQVVTDAVNAHFDRIKWSRESASFLRSELRYRGIKIPGDLNDFVDYVVGCGFGVTTGTSSRWIFSKNTP